jgi:hypothetical protein
MQRTRFRSHFSFARKDMGACTSDGAGDDKQTREREVWASGALVLRLPSHDFVYPLPREVVGRDARTAEWNGTHRACLAARKWSTQGGGRPARRLQEKLMLDQSFEKNHLENASRKFCLENEDTAPAAACMVDARGLSFACMLARHRIRRDCS